MVDINTSVAGSRDSKDASSAPIPPAEVQDQMNRVLASPEFRRSTRLQRFLRLAVERTLAGEVDLLKEYIVGREVFDRGTDYDPSVDSIVRVEAQRLRRKLREYYQTHGRKDPILIAFQSGGYVPAFARVAHPDPAPVAAEPERVVTLTRPNPRTVAVLPFSNLSPEPEQEYFCDGITEDIINAISSIPKLQVIGRTSLFALKRIEDPHEIGLRLGAGTIIEGTVRKAGELLRVSARILDSGNRKVRWSQVFDRKTSDVFSIENEIAHAIARALRAGWQPEWILKAPSTEAYILYLKGRQAWNQMSLKGYQSAIEQFNRAISLYPDFAAPYAGLADVHTWLALWGMMRPREALPRGKQAALEALRLDPESAQAYSSLGAAKFLFDWDWQQSLVLLKRALELQPGYLDGLQIYGTCLVFLGRFEEARASLEQAVHLDPLSFRMNRTLGTLCYLQGRANEAERWLEAAIALEPDSVESHYLLARLHLQQRRFDAAVNEALKCREDPSSALALGILGVALMRQGDKAGALSTVERLSELSLVGYVDPLASALVHVALGNSDAALECLGNSLMERSPAVLLLNVDPLFDEIRPDPRFQDLVSSLKFL
jgi:serine/threonine-protein kinase